MELLLCGLAWRFYTRWSGVSVSIRRMNRRPCVLSVVASAAQQFGDRYLVAQEAIDNKRAATSSRAFAY
jgi:hypothetical protein